MAAALATVAGALAALAITGSGRAGRLLDAGSMLPLGTSAVTIGLGMLIAFGRPPIDWRAAWWLIPVGQALVATPFVVRLLVPVLRAIPPDQRAAAATLGASPTRAWLEVDGRALRRAAGHRRGVRRGDLARRVRGDDVPHPHRAGDAADRHRPAARPARRAGPGAGLRHGDDPARAHRRRARRRRHRGAIGGDRAGGARATLVVALRRARPCSTAGR